MLTAGLSVVEYICVCDEGVMGFHNDRRTDAKMPANDMSDVTFFIIDNIMLNYNTIVVEFHELCCN